MKWGSRGDQDGQFMGLTGIAIDAQGNIYVTDREGNGIQKFDSHGQFLAKWDTCGDGKFPTVDSATGISVDTQGNIYVSDRSNNRICKYDSNGHFLTRWGGPDATAGQPRLPSPAGNAVDQQGNVYVAELFNNLVVKFRQR